MNKRKSFYNIHMGSAAHIETFIILPDAELRWLW